MDEELSAQDYRLLFELRRSIRRFLRFSEDAARSSGIEPQQHQAMLAIRANQDQGFARIGDIADWLQLRHHSAVELIDRLAGRGLVERWRDDEDRRFVNVRLTKEGEQVLAELTRHHQAELRKAGPALARVLGQITGSGKPTQAAQDALEHETATPGGI
jgi:DNA-binding MarR family transcriptional regulator